MKNEEIVSALAKLDLFSYPYDEVLNLVSLMIDWRI